MLYIKAKLDKVEFLNLQEKHLRIYGLWNRNDDSLYFLITIFQVSVQFLYVISSALFVICGDYSFLTLIRTGIMMSICYVATYRVVIWLMYEKEMQKLCAFARSSEFDQTDPIIKRGHAISYAYASYLIFAAASIVILSYIPSIFQIIIFQEDYRNATLPYSNWLPFDMHASRTNYIIAMIYQMDAFWQNIVMLAGVHATFLSLMVKISSHFDLVADHLSKIDASHSNAYCELKKCVKELEIIESLAKDVNKFNSLGLTGQFIPIFFIVTACILVITTQPLKSVMPEIVFGIACLFDLFVYCWVGEQIFYHSNRVHAQAYNINWNEGTREFQKAILLTLLKLNEGKAFYVGGFLPLQLSTFVQTLRATYSIYTLLKGFAE